jgi:predicted O-methyltransferase YrrM
MDFLPEKINEYAENFSQPESEVLKQLNRDTYARILNPRMLSGHLQGRMLAMFSKMIQPKRILEIGTYTGYSTICMSEGLAEGGAIDTIEKNEELEEMILNYFEKAEVIQKINLHIGNAIQIIKTLNNKYDLVFIDADKENYSNYFDLIIDNVNAHGIIIADNVLWSGKVVDKIDEKDLETKAIVGFNKKVHEDKRVENVLLPVRDGLMVMRKK